ncbi:hypothetical protein [Streptomyces sp. CAU 1734]|uniref:hypothetical protein n=1 Tax=Streptomyces sp. CAU 1734 TaxID=3140360 RepID=UPI0032601D74
MAARKTTPRKPAKPQFKPCPPCGGTGELTEPVRVGRGKGRATDQMQSAVCSGCWGSGEIPADD